MRPLFTGALMGIGLVVVLAAQRPPHFDRAPTCIYMTIGADSLRIASYAPPCDPGGNRPHEDTVRTWRLPSQARSCDGAVLIDATGAARVAWLNCGDGVLRRVSL